MPEEEKLGIEALKTVAGFACELANDVLASFEDGKFTISDVPRFLDDVIALPKTIKAIPSVDDEWLDIDDAEMAEFETFVVSRLKLPAGASTEEINAIIKAVIKLIMRLSSVTKAVLELVDAIKQLKNGD